jgi:hypothetical protein
MLMREEQTDLGSDLPAPLRTDYFAAASLVIGALLTDRPQDLSVSLALSLLDAVVLFS